MLLMSVENPGECFFTDLILLSSIIFTFSLVMFVMLNLILKNTTQTSLFLSILFLSICVINNKFSFDNVNMIWASTFIISLLALYFNKKYKFCQKKHLTILFILLVFISLFYFSKIYLAKVRIEKNIAKYATKAKLDDLDMKIDPNLKVSEQMPNIYYIILDEFASERAFSEQYHIHDMELFNLLRKNNFNVIKNSYSNYPWTIPSISSSLNMEYHEQMGVKNEFPALAHYMIINNRVKHYLEFYGYKTYMQPSVYWLGRESQGMLKDFIKRSYSYGLFQSYFQLTPLNYLVRGYQRVQHRNYALEQLDFLKKSVNFKGPYFIYSHILCPHRPIVFRRDGTSLNQNEIKVSEKDPKHEMYVEQAIFISQAIAGTIEHILKNSKESPVIILQSDHGRFPIGYSGKGKNDFPIDKMSWRFSNLNALYLPNKKVVFPKFFSSVNNFRLVFNLYFSKNMPLLEDKCFYNSYDFQQYYLPEELSKNQK